MIILKGYYFKKGDKMSNYARISKATNELDKAEKDYYILKGLLMSLLNIWQIY